MNKSRSFWAQAARRFLRNKRAFIALIILCLLMLASLLGPYFIKYSYYAQDLMIGATSPSREHLLGTDTLGRDLLVRIMYGGRISILIGVLATSVAVIIGVFYGTVAGYIGGRTDNVMMRIVDMLYALPYMFFVIILMVVFGRNILNLFLALGAVEWLTTSRITRGQVLSLKNKEFIEAAKACGTKPIFIIFRHLIPNAISPVVVYATLLIPEIIIFESFLSFLGLGVQPPMCSLGSLVADGSKLMELFPWLLIFPCAVLTLLLFCLNFIGDGLRDAIDPKMKL